MAASSSRPARGAAPRKAAARKSARPRPARALPASSPLIARLPETSDEYLDRLTSVISRRGTHVYFDASFLMWLVKLGRPARAQFFAWVSAVGAQRFHVPLWAAHEFYKHLARKTIFNDFGSDLASFDKAANNLYEKIRSFCSDGLFGFPTAGDMFVDDFKRTIQPLRTMLNLARRNSGAEIEFANREVATFVDAHLLAGPLSRVIENIEEEERIRNRGKIPPSFNDAQKRAAREEGDNSFGDLVFWRESLRHAADVSASALVVATADRKNDWFVNYFGTASVSPDMRQKVQNPRPVPMPHPLLVREALDSGAGDLALVDPVYCGALIERKGQEYKAFADAAMDVALPQVVQTNAEGQIWAARVGHTARLIAVPEFPVDGHAQPAAAGTVVGEEGQTEVASVTLDSDLLRATREDISALAQPFFQALDAAANVATRAEVYDRINWNELGDWSQADLVILGRQLMSGAETGDASARRLVSDLRDQAASIPPATANAVYLGALGSVYFGDDCNRRTPSGSAISQALFDVVTFPALAKATEALATLLNAGEPKPIFIPGEPASAVELEIVIRPSADNRSPADLVAVNFKNRNLITDLQTEADLRFTTIFGRPAAARDFRVAEICDAVARYHLLPRQLVKPSREPTSIVRVAEFAGVDIDI